MKAPYQKRKDYITKSSLERTLDEVTSNEDTIAPSNLLYQLSKQTENPADLKTIIEYIRGRLESDPSGWRSIFKTLLLIDYLLKNGSDLCVREIGDLRCILKLVKKFSYTDNSVDRGANIREKAGQLVDLISDPKKVEEQRELSKKMYEKLNGAKKVTTQHLDKDSYAVNAFQSSLGIQKPTAKTGFEGFGSKDIVKGYGAFSSKDIKAEIFDLGKFSKNDVTPSKPTTQPSTTATSSADGTGNENKETPKKEKVCVKSLHRNKTQNEKKPKKETSEDVPKEQEKVQPDEIPNNTWDWDNVNIIVTEKVQNEQPQEQKQSSEGSTKSNESQGNCSEHEDAPEKDEKDASPVFDTMTGSVQSTNPQPVVQDPLSQLIDLSDFKEVITTQAIREKVYGDANGVNLLHINPDENITLETA